jgi:hypothetical protein
MWDHTQRYLGELFENLFHLRLELALTEGTWNAWQNWKLVALADPNNDVPECTKVEVLPPVSKFRKLPALLHGSPFPTRCFEKGGWEYCECRCGQTGVDGVIETDNIRVFYQHTVSKDRRDDTHATVFHELMADDGTTVLVIVAPDYIRTHHKGWTRPAAFVFPPSKRKQSETRQDATEDEVKQKLANVVQYVLYVTDEFLGVEHQDS